MSNEAISSSRPTEELFREDSRLTQCVARVCAVDARGVQLDRTVFYPQGGGQAGDAGELLLADGTSLVIADTRKGEAPGEIVHVPAAEQPEALSRLRPGVEVTARIDWERRHRHMRFHTATHLLCALVPHPVDGCSITAEYARLDFHMNDALDKDALNAGISRLVAASHPVRHRWISDAELEANPGLVRTMSVKPPMGSGRVRLVLIGKDGCVDMQPCGGTHVRATGEIGRLAVTKIEKKGKLNRRIRVAFA